MNDTGTLIKQLRIEREEPVRMSGSGRWLMPGLGLAVMLAASAAWWSFGRQELVLIDVVVATAAQAASAADNAVLNASGYVVARRQATVSAKVTARVREVFIDEGQAVAEGEVIATLDDTNLEAAWEHSRAQREQARASLHAAETALANEEPLFARVREQFERGISSRQDFDTAKARYEAARAVLDVAKQTVAVAEAGLQIAQRNLDDTIVRAPFAGIVTVKAAQPGEMVSPISAGGGFTRTGIGTIVDMDSLEVDVDVSESFINRIAAGQRVSVRLNAYPDWEIPARVITVVPTADRAKATVKVRIALEADDPRILPDMGARVAFLRDAETPDATVPAFSGVIVPKEAVLVEGTSGALYVVQGDIVSARTVQLGEATASGWLISEGINPGTRLAASALDALYDGAPVRIRQ